LKLPAARTFALIALIVWACLAAPATAGGLTEAERLMVEKNPALRELAASSPDDLREALDLIAKALANPSNSRGGPDELDAADVKLLGQNPALLQVWRS
jgi:hypothetical protein